MQQIKKGFTLIELLMVIVIIGTLSAFAVPQYKRALERSRVSEALTMLRAIYDSCERLAWEKGKDNCGQAVQQAGANFAKLDIIAKGEYQAVGARENLKLVTPNFSYTLPSQSGSPITAAARTGQFPGKMITFDGKWFHCGGDADACKVWASDTWNDGANE